MQVFFQANLKGLGNLVLSEEEAHHALRVLRLHEGNLLDLTNGRGGLGKAEIIEANSKKCIIQVLDYQEEKRNRNYELHLAVAPTKNAERMEWLVEKCTEIGIDRISFFQADHSERAYLNLQRLEKKAISAMKQSLQLFLPILRNYSHFSELICQIETQEKYIAYVDQQNPIHLFDLAKIGGNYCVLIGPEGDFSHAELALALEKGFQKVSLGQTRLRTETAALVACQTIALRNRESF